MNLGCAANQTAGQLNFLIQQAARLVLLQSVCATGCAPRCARSGQRSIPEAKFRHSGQLDGMTEAPFQFCETAWAISPNRKVASVMQGWRTFGCDNKI
jgi:hypothetical protein